MDFVSPLLPHGYRSDYSWERDKNILSDAQKQYIKDLYSYRELLYFFVWRDIVVRYKEAFFGIAWALVRPLLNMLIFALVFGKIARLDSGDVNYSAFVLAGILPWQLCSMAIVEGANSILGNMHLVSKIYFPRLILPTAQIGVHFLDFMIGIVFLFLFCFFVQPISFPQVLSLPFFIFLALMFCVGGVLWLSALTVRYKDIRFVVPFIVQIGMFLSPVAYGSDLIAPKWMLLYSLNPMVGIINGFRWALFNQQTPYLGYSVFVSFVVISLILMSSFFYFRKTENSFVDRL